MNNDSVWRDYQRMKGLALAPSPCQVTPHSAIMAELTEQIAVLGQGDGVVLVLGEPGLAKGCYAETIHAASRRSRHRIASIWCDGLERNDFENVFGAGGDAPASAIGAHRQTILEAVRGGTLFFNEIGALNAGMQEALFEIIATRSLARRGGGAPISVDARVIASSSLDLVEAVNEGRFREDLYYQISPTPVSVPPLRARSEGDIAQMVDHITRILALELHGSPSAVVEQALLRLVRYPWPGNIREMRNALERAMVAARGHDAIALAHLPPEVRDPLGFDGEYVPRTLEELERLHIERTLRRHHQNRTHAANELGISRATLIKKVREYGLAPKGRSGRPDAEAKRVK